MRGELGVSADSSLVFICAMLPRQCKKMRKLLMHPHLLQNSGCKNEREGSTGGMYMRTMFGYKTLGEIEEEYKMPISRFNICKF